MILTGAANSHDGAEAEAGAGTEAEHRASPAIHISCSNHGGGGVCKGAYGHNRGHPNDMKKSLERRALIISTSIKLNFPVLSSTFVQKNSGSRSSSIYLFASWLKSFTCNLS